MNLIKKVSLYIFFALLAYMPLHIFLSTWFGTSFGALEIAKVLKDVVLVTGFACVLAASWSRPGFREFVKDKLAWLVVGYAALTILLALLINTDQDAEILGVVYNLRFLVFFLYAGLLAKLYAKENIQAKAVKIVLAVGAVVLAFGVLQYTLLPNDALTHLGYSRANGVLPAFFIDDKPDLERVMSTLRDPNSFGSYVMILFSIALTYLLKTKNREVKRIAGGLVGLSVLCLYFTFSRSAWIGAVIAAVVAGALVLKQRSNWKAGKNLVIAGCVLIALLAAGLFAARGTYFVQNVILHADESTTLEDPNQLRLRFWRESVESAADRPLGYGPGTAGLASIRNQAGVILNENYYFQILHEVGVVGLLLFLMILVMVAVRLYRLTKDNWTAIALLAAFAGLAATNFLVHIWSNEAVAYTWWGLAGLVIFMPVTNRVSLKKKRTK